MSEQFGSGPEIYNGYSTDDEDQPQAFGDSLSDDRGLREPLDEGYSPADRWSIGQRFGNTNYEQARGESLADRLAQEEPEPDPYAPGADEATWGARVGGLRAGRLAAFDPGIGGTISEHWSVPPDPEHQAATSFGEPYWSRQVGGQRAGRLLAYDQGEYQEDLFARDVGIDGAGASAEEAAMHVLDVDDWLNG